MSSTETSFGKGPISGPASGYSSGGQRQLILSSRHFLVFVLLSYGMVLSPFVDAGLRNYLVLSAALIGGLLFLVFRLKLTRQFYLGLLLFTLMSSQALFISGGAELGSVALTLVYAIGYFSIVSMLGRVPDKRQFVRHIMAWIIKAFAVLSILQMVTSFIGLPIPNIMATKGLWSYNSFALEPSQLGRVIGLTMLVYLMLDRTPLRLAQVSRAKLKVTLAFVATMLLSGSALAALAIPLVFILSRSLKWVVVFVMLTVVIWPLILLIDFEPLRRATLLLSNLGSMDLRALLDADSSGASRIIPALIYLQEANPAEAGFWFGYGGEGLSRYFLGRIPGFGEKVPAGFLPGFGVVYGMIGLGLFLWTFVLRFMNRITAPVMAFWLVFFFSSAWNTQVFWYGIILIYLAWAADSDPDLGTEPDFAPALPAAPQKDTPA